MLAVDTQSLFCDPNVTETQAKIWRSGSPMSVSGWLEIANGYEMANIASRNKEEVSYCFRVIDQSDQRDLPTQSFCYTQYNKYFADRP